MAIFLSIDFSALDPASAVDGLGHFYLSQTQSAHPKAGGNMNLTIMELSETTRIAQTQPIIPGTIYDLVSKGGKFRRHNAIITIPASVNVVANTATTAPGNRF